MTSSRIILVTGGSRSGKTGYALERALTFENRIYLATAQSIDEEMDARIARHRLERGNSFTTWEEPLDLAATIKCVPVSTDVVLIDCMTVWLGNLMHNYGPQEESYPEVQAFLQVLQAPPCHLVIVTNEIGMGIVPGDAMSRSFRDHAGWLNQDIAKLADEVVMVACGLPLTLKRTP